MRYSVFYYMIRNLKYLNPLLFQLRNHMSQVIKQQGSQYGINLNVEQSMQMHIETRLIQVDCAIKMELWQVRKYVLKSLFRIGLQMLISSFLWII